MSIDKIETPATSLVGIDLEKLEGKLLIFVLGNDTWPVTQEGINAFAECIEGMEDLKEEPFKGSSILFTSHAMLNKIFVDGEEVKYTKEFQKKMQEYLNELAKGE